MQVWILSREHVHFPRSQKETGGVNSSGGSWGHPENSWPECHQQLQSDSETVGTGSIAPQYQVQSTCWSTREIGIARWGSDNFIQMYFLSFIGIKKITHICFIIVPTGLGCSNNLCKSVVSFIFSCLYLATDHFFRSNNFCKPKNL